MTRMGFYGAQASSIGVRHDLGIAALTATAERGEVHRPTVNRSLDQPAYSIGSVSLDRTLGRARLTLGATRLDERETVLGGRMSSAFTSGGSTSWFADASGAYDLGRGWAIYGSYRRGWTAMPGTGALAERGRLATDAWAFDVSKQSLFRSGDTLAVRLMQPLRVRSGGFDFSMPVSYDYADGSVGYEQRFFNLAPTGREIDLEAAYGTRLRGGNLTAHAFVRREPGHIEAMSDDYGAAIRFTLGF
jgi:hypothetical protein